MSRLPIERKVQPNKWTCFVAFVGITACSSEGVVTPAPCEGLVVRAVSQTNRGSPMAGVDIQINGGEWLTTNDRGEACFDGVTGAYDVVVYQPFVLPRSGVNSDDVWTLLSRTDNPLIVPVDNNDFPPCAVTTEVTGRQQPTSRLGFESTNTGARTAVLGVEETSTVEDFREIVPSPARLRFYEYEAPEESPWQPTRFLSYGHVDMTIEQMQPDPTPGVQDRETAPCRGQAQVELQPVETARVTGALGVPDVLAGDDIYTHSILRFPHTSMAFESAPPAGATRYDVIYPVIADRAAVVVAAGTIPTVELIAPTYLYFRSASAYVERVVNSSSTSIDLEFGLPANLIEPADNDVVADPATTFRWTAMSNADFYYLNGNCEAVENDEVVRFIDFKIETRTATARLPSIPALFASPGIVLRCDWSATSVQVDADGRREATSSSRLITIDPRTS